MAASSPKQEMQVSFDARQISPDTEIAGKCLFDLWFAVRMNVGKGCMLPLQPPRGFPFTIAKLAALYYIMYYAL